MSVIPVEATVIVCVEVRAVNEYQTSSSAVPVRALQVVAGKLLVAATVVPAVVIQATFDVKEIAPEQLLFAGCA
jgi:hypothetical protein